MMQLASRLVAVCKTFLPFIFRRKFRLTTNAWICWKDCPGNWSARDLQKEHMPRQVAWRKQYNQPKNYMSTLVAKGNWNIAKGKLKQKFAQFTDDELQFIEGKEDELTGRIQKRTGQARGQIKHILKECCDCKL